MSTVSLQITLLKLTQNDGEHEYDVLNNGDQHCGSVSRAAAMGQLQIQYLYKRSKRLWSDYYVSVHIVRNNTVRVNGVNSRKERHV